MTSSKRRLRKRNKGEISQAIVWLLLSVASIYLVFIPPIVTLDEALKTYGTPIPSEKLQQDLLFKQLDKSNQEIAQLIEEESDWYEKKFLFVGAMIAVFISAFFNRKQEIDNQPAIVHVANRPLTLMVLAISVVVSLSIDAYIRNNRNLISTHGTWIYEFVDNSVFVDGNDEADKNVFRSWEQFLRVKIPKGEGEFLTGRHSSFGQKFFMWSHVYYTTLLLYILYLFAFVFQKNKYQEKSLENFAWLGFGMVHFTLFVSAVTSNNIPSAFIAQHPIFEVIEKATGDGSQSAMYRSLEGVECCLVYGFLSLLTAFSAFTFCRKVSFPLRNQIDKGASHD